ncbi:MAG TPA: hypothetical protein ENI07_13550 [Desulfobacterales bacterium]|nr:hypothetical protein [Desulfobacterales bacterium]
MPALNFQKQFAGAVERSEKCQTIRAYRKDCRNPQPKQTLFLYTGMRTKYCRKLGEYKCKSVSPIAIEKSFDVIVGINSLSVREKKELSAADGFDSIQDFYDFFIRHHGLPFYGLLIMW